MAVWVSWQASCDCCQKPAPDKYITQAYLLEALRRAGWKYKREPMASGYTKLVVHCPECSEQLKAGT